MPHHFWPIVGGITILLALWALWAYLFVIGVDDEEQDCE